MTQPARVFAAGKRRENAGAKPSVCKTRQKTPREPDAQDQWPAGHGLAPALVTKSIEHHKMDTMSNLKSSDRNDLHFHIIMAILGGVVIAINFLGMLFRTLQIKSSTLVWQIIPSLLIMLQIPLFPVLLGFIIYSLGFLFVHRKTKFQNIEVARRRLIKIQTFYVLYFVVMFTYWGVSMMSRLQ